MNDWLMMFVLGVVEGVTEFLPISSTGHLILVSAWMGEGSDKSHAIDIMIQLGAILAVVWEFRARLMSTVVEAKSRLLMVNLLIAFLPAALLGLIFHKHIKAYLFNPTTVALALFFGALVMAASEWWVKKRENNKVSHPEQAATLTDELQSMSPFKALLIGLFQTLAMIPGTSRSAATIVGGLLSGLSRTAATEFSFLLALPTLGGAFVYELYKSHHLFSANDAMLLMFGLVISFVVALISIRWLLGYIRHHSFMIFVWYRIALALLVYVVLIK